jgi:hypothetical protein
VLVGCAVAARPASGHPEETAAPPSGILDENVEEHASVDEDGQHSPRVSARIECVVIRTEPGRAGAARPAPRKLITTRPTAVSPSSRRSSSHRAP